MTLNKLFAGCIAAFISTNLSAQEQQTNPNKDDPELNYSIGLMAGSTQSLYLGGDDQTEVMPWLSLEWGRFFIMGPSFGMHLYQNENWSVSSSIVLDGIGDGDRDNSRELSDMKDLDSVVMGEVSVAYEDFWGGVNLSLNADISNTHDGYTVGLSYVYPIQAGRWQIMPELEVEWASEEVNTFYYGVTQQQARSDRAFYEAGAGVNYGASVTAFYPLAENHSLLIQASYTSYANEITDSPIVDRKNTSEIGVGYVYRF